MTKSLAPFSALLALCLTLLAPLSAAAKGFIRDAEIEATIRAYAAPLFEAAGLSADAVRIYIVNDEALNAFVAGGQNLFLHTGLLMRAEHAGQVLGVIAHETGHMAGGHLARRKEEMRNASLEQVLVFALGLGAAVASGESRAGAAVVSGGQSLMQLDLLRFSRTQESAADHAALSYLDQTGQSARGMLEFLEILEDQELLLSGRQEAYVRTHPIAAERIDTIRHHVAESPFSDTPVPADYAEGHRRMRAKLIGFLQPLGRVLHYYPETDKSPEGRYARAIAYFRASRLPEALQLMDGLLAEAPEDAYFHELKGQMLFQGGRGADALPFYQKAVQLQPHAPLIREGLARVLIELGRPAEIKSAIGHLEEVVRLDPEDASAWRSLGIAYGRDGQLGMAALALAEAASARGNEGEAGEQAERALRQLPEGSPAWQRAQDISAAASRDEP